MAHNSGKAGFITSPPSHSSTTRVCRFIFMALLLSVAVVTYYCWTTTVNNSMLQDRVTRLGRDFSLMRNQRAAAEKNLAECKSRLARLQSTHDGVTRQLSQANDDLSDLRREQEAEKSAAASCEQKLTTLTQKQSEDMKAVTEERKECQSHLDTIQAECIKHGRMKELRVLRAVYELTDAKVMQHLRDTYNVDITGVDIKTAPSPSEQQQVQRQVQDPDPPRGLASQDQSSNSRPVVPRKQTDLPQSGHQAKQPTETGRPGQYADQQLAARLDKLTDQRHGQPGGLEQKPVHSLAAVPITPSVEEKLVRQGAEQKPQREQDEISLNDTVESGRNEMANGKPPAMTGESQSPQQQEPSHSQREKEPFAARAEEGAGTAGRVEGARGQPASEGQVSVKDFRLKDAGEEEYKETEYEEDHPPKDEDMAGKTRSAEAPVGQQQIPPPPGETKRDQYQNDNDAEYEVNKDALRQNGV